MKPERLSSHVFEVLGRSAGDLSWQRDPDAPPSCVPGPELDRFERLEWFALFDTAGPGMVSRKSWTRIREAIALCAGCPLRAACLDYAVEHQAKIEGVWGGMYFPARGDAQHPPEVAAALEAAEQVA